MTARHCAPPPLLLIDDFFADNFHLPTQVIWLAAFSTSVIPLASAIIYSHIRHSVTNCHTLFILLRNFFALAFALISSQNKDKKDFTEALRRAVIAHKIKVFRFQLVNLLYLKRIIYVNEIQPLFIGAYQFQSSLDATCVDRDGWVRGWFGKNEML